MTTTYVTNKDNPCLKLPGVIQGKEDEPSIDVVFVLCVYKTDDEAIIKKLDQLIATRPSIAQLVRKVDREAAEKLALEHQARQQGAKGPFSSEHIHLAHKEELKARDADIELARSDPETAAAMSEQIRETDLQLTEDGTKQIVRDSGDGFTPATPEPAAEETAAVATDHVPAEQAPAETPSKTKLLLGGGKK